MKRILSAEEKAKLKEGYWKEAEKSFEGMFGDGTLDELVTFRQKEDRACEMVDRLWQWMMEKQIDKDAKTNEELKRRQCPQCGGMGRAHKPEEKDEEREIMGKRGAVTYEREGYYCGRCRKVFFPSGPADGDRDRGIQSQRA